MRLACFSVVLQTNISVFVQVMFILVWRRSICGTVSSWERFHPVCCSTRCSISSLSSSTTRLWSSTVPSLSATSSAALGARAAPKWPVCASIPPKRTQALVSGQSYYHSLIGVFVFLLCVSFVCFVQCRWHPCKEKKGRGWRQWHYIWDKGKFRQSSPLSCQAVRVLYLKMVCLFEITDKYTLPLKSLGSVRFLLLTKAFIQSKIQ